MTNHVYQWRRFHHFNPYKKEEEERAAKIAQEQKQLNKMGERMKDPKIIRKRTDHTHLTVRQKRVPVTLPSMKWGNNGTDS